MLLTLEVSKLERLIESKDLQPLNIEFIEITEDVLKFETSIEVKNSHLENKPHISNFRSIKM